MRSVEKYLFCTESEKSAQPVARVRKKIPRALSVNYFNLSSVFILHYHAFNPLPIFFFSCLILTDAALTCLKCPRGRVAVFRDR